MLARRFISELIHDFDAVRIEEPPLTVPRPLTCGFPGLLPKVRARTAFLAAVVAVGVLLAAPSARAATRYWDPNGTSNDIGGRGTWDTAASLWTTSSDGNSGSYSPWVSTDDAHFTGEPGYVAFTSITANSLTFDGSLFDFPSGTLAITSGNIDTGSHSDTITATLTSPTKLTKMGDGTLTLNSGGGNTFSGGVTIKGGTLSISNESQLGAAATNPVTFGGPGATLATAAGFTTARVFTLGTGNTFDIAGGQTVTLTNTTTGLTGPGGLVVQGGGTLALSGTNNFTGTTTINSGATVSLSFAGGNSQKIDPNQALVLGGGTLTITGGGTTTNPAVHGLTLNPGAGAVSITKGGGHQRGADPGGDRTEHRLDARGDHDPSVGDHHVPR